MCTSEDQAAPRGEVRSIALIVSSFLVALIAPGPLDGGIAQGFQEAPPEVFDRTTVPASTLSTVEGYYKDLFVDGGVYLSDMKSMPAAQSLGLSAEYLAVGNSDSDKAKQNRLLVSNPGVDDNGLLLYPDGEPRFRMVYVNGGSATNHGNSLGEGGRQRFRQFTQNGGSYSGSCAGAFIASLHATPSAYLNGPDGKRGTSDDNTPWPSYFHIWPGVMEGSSLQSKRPDLEAIPGMENHPFWQFFPSLQDGWVNECYFNGGPKTMRDDIGELAELEKTEFLARYILPEETSLHKGTGLLAYKRDAYSGRLVIIGCHPEFTGSGERLDLMKAIVLYALQGSGEPQVKASLTDGEARRMNDNGRGGYEKIGDKQYHHFTVEIPEGTALLEISLDGAEGYDLDLYLKRGDFAFDPQADYFSKSSAADEFIRVTDPAPGTWYIGVQLETTVTYNKEDYDNFYTGKTAVLNGVAYTVRADWTSQPPPPPPAPELIAHWTLDETDGTRGDDAGHGNQLTDHGGVTSALGRLAGGADFERDAAQYLSLDEGGTDLDVTGSLSLVGWIKPESLGEVMVLASKYEWDVTNRTYRFLVWKDNRLRFDASHNGEFNYDDNVLLGSATLDPDRWYHVAAVFDAPNHTMSIYLDGQLDASRSVSFDALYPSSAPFMLGANMSTGEVVQQFDGLLDDWRVYTGALNQGAIQELMRQTTFADVPFDHPFHDEIEALRWKGYSAGCASDPLRFCPDDTMSRAESAVFVERGVHSTDYTPQDPTEKLFSDVDLGTWYAKWATALYLDGYSAGCASNPLKFCPDQGHTRAEGAVFTLRVRHGLDYAPPAPQGIFSDVPVDWWGAKWAEAAYNESLIPACGEEPLSFCPQDPLTRGLAAFMMVRAKGLQLPEP